MTDGRKSLLNTSERWPGSTPTQQELDTHIYKYLLKRDSKWKPFFLDSKSNPPGELGQCGDGAPVAPQAPGIQRENVDAVIQDAAQIQPSLHIGQHTAVSVHSSCG